MSKRVLLVDDEPNVLNGIKRRLESEFELVTAESGAQALAAIDGGPPFAVIVTDMRMPKMDGIQLIKAARVESPDTVFVMLTGNQDQATAIQALNDGKVFRFLTKPCQSSDLKTAIEAALRQYQLVTSEKELLQNTFVAAVSVLTNVLEMSQPDIFGRAERVQEVMLLLQEKLGLESQWEYKLAARLGMLGFALLPEKDRTRFEMAVDSGDQLRATIHEAAMIGQRIIGRIPRLGTVARIIGTTAEVDGSMLKSSPKSEAEKATTGATLLRIGIEWDMLIRQGLSLSSASNEICQSLLKLPPCVANILCEQDESIPQGDGVEYDVSELKEGMVLLDDVQAGNGVMLVRSGRRLNWTIIEKLRSYETPKIKLEKIRVRDTKAVVDDPVCV